jgi:hypothetical protein
LAQIFHPSMNTISKASMLTLACGIIALIFVGAAYDRSPYITEVGVPIDQPVEFSHEHHVRELGIDCRYCHTSAETSSHAGIPPTHTCMTCHSQIWSTSPMLARVRDSYSTHTPIPWNRVHNVPDFAHFNHSIHINKGIGCSTCHGQINEMPQTWKVHTLRMEWCLDCHRDPARFIRPRDKIYDMSWKQLSSLDEGTRLLKEHGVRTDNLTNCSICHY